MAVASAYLDGGSKLIHRHAQPTSTNRASSPLAPEVEAFSQLLPVRASCLGPDVYDLPIATLEHIGGAMTNDGGDASVAEDSHELAAAVPELRRVLRPRGDGCVAVHVGRGERFDSARSLTPTEANEIECFRLQIRKPG
jgi:hypothetical protein